jgi:hypothetical protein
MTKKIDADGFRDGLHVHLRMILGDGVSFVLLIRNPDDDDVIMVPAASLLDLDFMANALTDYVTRRAANWSLALDSADIALAALACVSWERDIGARPCEKLSTAAHRSGALADARGLHGTRLQLREWQLGCSSDQRRSMLADQPVEVVKPLATRRG